MELRLTIQLADDTNKAAAGFFNKQVNEEGKLCLRGYTKVESTFPFDVSAAFAKTTDSHERSDTDHEQSLLQAVVPPHWQ